MQNNQLIHELLLKSFLDPIIINTFAVMSHNSPSVKKTMVVLLSAVVAGQ